MSEWYKADKDDIDVDFESEDMDIYVTHNDFGNIYVTLTFNQIKDINAQIEAIEARIEGKG